MKVKVTKPDSILFDGEANLVQLPGTNGLFEILPHHAPIISALAKGQLRIVTDDKQTHNYEIRGGVVKCQHDDIIILVQ